MKVKELIEQLQKANPEHKIKISTFIQITSKFSSVPELEEEYDDANHITILDSSQSLPTLPEF